MLLLKVAKSINTV